MAFGVQVQVAREPHAGERRRVGALRFGAGDRGALHLVEFGRREGRLAQRLGHQPQRARQVLLAHFDARALAAHGNRGVELVEGVLELRPGVLLAAAAQHAAGEIAGHLAVEQALFVAPVQREAGNDAAAARFLRQQRRVDAVGELAPEDARFDVGRRRVEGLAELERLGIVGAIGGKRFLQAGGRRDLGALGPLGRHEHAEDAVCRLQVMLGDALHVFQAQLAQALAIQEEQAPVAHGGKFGKGAHEGAGIELRFLEVVEQRGARASDFLSGNSVLAEAFDGLDQRVARPVQGRGLVERRAEVHVARIVQAALAAPDRARQAFLHERAVQPPARRVAEHVGEHVDGRIVGVGAGRHAVHQRDELVVAAAAQDHRALAVLGRLLGVERRQRPRRPRQGAEVPGHQLDGARFVEAPGDDQHRVVGLVPGAVEGLQPVDRHPLDVRAHADDRIAVVVPGVGRLLHALEQHAAGVVLAKLELVAHHAHLAVEVLLGDERVHHAVGFHLDRPREIVVAGREGLEVGRAVVRRGAVPARAAARELFLDVGMARGALEQQVLEQVRHALLAVALVARADQVGDVHRGGVDARVGQREQAQAVRQRVLGNAFQRDDFARRLGGRS